MEIEEVSVQMNEEHSITITLSHRDAELIRSVLWFEWMNMDLEDEADNAVGRVLSVLDAYLRLED